MNFRIMKSREKRGQMEIIGLVIIVILITLGLLFMVQFALRSKPTTALFLRKELAASSLSTLLKTIVKDGVCGEARPQFSEVLIDCARHFPAEVSTSVLQCESKHSCQFFVESVRRLLDSSIGSWQHSYELRAQLIRASGVSPEELIPPIKGKSGCPRTKGRHSSGAFPLPTVDAGLIEVVLYVCD